MGSYTYLKKANGTTYVYWQVSRWDSERGMSVPEKTCVGKLGTNGEIVYNKRFAVSEAVECLECGREDADAVSVGQSMLLDAAYMRSGLSAALSDVFSKAETARIVSVAYTIVAQDSGMYGAESWMESHECPCHKQPLSSPRISEMFAAITPSLMESFLLRWASSLAEAEKGHYCFDVTSVSSTNETNPFVEWGYNRDKEKMPQVNIALLSGMTSRLPTSYILLPGSVSDTTCVDELVGRMAKYGIKGIGLILDRGFHSLDNVNDMIAARHRFMMPVPGNVNAAKHLIDSCRADIESDLHFVEVSDDGTAAVYGMSIPGTVSGKRIWQHVYFDTARRVEHISVFFAKLSVWERELKEKRPKKSNKANYGKYFIVKNTPKRGYRVRRNMAAINEFKTDYAGYWVIVTNFEKDAKKALNLYRQRSRVEQHYDDLKNELDMMRVRTHRKETMTGRIFVHFIALIILQQLRIMMEDSGLQDGTLTVRTMMKKVDSYTRIKFKGKYKDIHSTMTKSQREIFKAFGLLKL
jgi:transposase